jgi:putative membrane protein
MLPVPVNSENASRPLCRPNCPSHPSYIRADRRDFRIFVGLVPDAQGPAKLDIGVAAPLILLGAPAIALLHGLPQKVVRRVLRPLARSRAVHSLGDIVTHPVFCWLVSTSVVIGWHISALFEQGMQSAGWHAVEHASFLVASLLFWWPVIQPWPSIAEWPRWRIPLYLFLATLPCDALSAFLTFCNRVVYPHYLSAHRIFFISALADQECAGALMWVCVTFGYLIPGVVVTIRMLTEQRRTSQVEVI